MAEHVQQDDVKFRRKKTTRRKLIRKDPSRCTKLAERFGKAEVDEFVRTTRPLIRKKKG